MVELYSTYSFLLFCLYFYDRLVSAIQINFRNSIFVVAFSVGLAYANIELKSEVQNLSSRVTESKMIESINNVL